MFGSLIYQKTPCKSLLLTNTHPGRKQDFKLISVIEIIIVT